VTGIDPTRDARLEKIEHGLDQLFRQNLAIIEGLDRLYRIGGTRLGEIEDAGSDRLDQIEAKLDRLIGRLG